MNKLTKVNKLVVKCQKLQSEINAIESSIAKELETITGFDFSQEFLIQYQPQDGFTVVFTGLSDYSYETEEQRILSKIYKERESTAMPIKEFIDLIEQGKTKLEIVKGAWF